MQWNIIDLKNITNAHTKSYLSLFTVTIANTYLWFIEISTGIDVIEVLRFNYGVIRIGDLRKWHHWFSEEKRS
jgi:hypothetical protein